MNYRPEILQEEGPERREMRGRVLTVSAGIENLHIAFRTQYSHTEERTEIRTASPAAREEVVYTPGASPQSGNYSAEATQPAINHTEEEIRSDDPTLQQKPSHGDKDSVAEAERAVKDAFTHARPAAEDNPLFDTGAKQ